MCLPPGYCVQGTGGVFVRSENMSDKDNKINPEYGQSGRINWAWVVRAVIIAALDAVIVAGSYGLALLIRFDFIFSRIPPEHIRGYQQMVIPYIVCLIVIYWYFRLYHSIWRFVSVVELGRVMMAWIVFQAAVYILYLITHIRMPLSFYAIGGILVLGLTAALRFSYRFLRAMRHHPWKRDKNSRSTRVMVIGGGEAGRSIIHELLATRYKEEKVCCIVDDNPTIKGHFLDGIPIVGGRQEIPAAVKKYGISKIIFAIPTATVANRRDILKICQSTGCSVLTVPGIGQLLDGKVSISRLRALQIEDLLGREPAKINNEEVRQFIAGKVVLVTGGGGSIGSEICRQVAKDEPKMLIIFDIYENNAYAIQQELRRRWGEKLNLVTLIGSVRDEERICEVLSQYRPDIIIHAAAHKHVPLMEDSPCEAIKNNPCGTYRLAHAAVRFGVKRFVLISTDKAVNPTNVMGASKRLCEMIIQMMNRKAAGTTVFTAVRFGNVLGSNGSVIPLFRRQIAEGGPVTVTDPRVIRYFMTIPEAVSLVLQSACYARGGEIFVLDMGEPVRIDDMARQLIRLSGYEPDVDIKVVYTGLRPGEKLYEELLMGEEGLKETSNSMIRIVEPIDMDDEAFEKAYFRLSQAAEEGSPRIRDMIAEVIGTYHPGSIGDVRTAERAGAAHGSI